MPLRAPATCLAQLPPLVLPLAHPQELYLGPPGALHPFYDQRLYDYWTFFGQNETVWMDLGDNNQFRLFRNETLWTIGNK